MRWTLLVLLALAGCDDHILGPVTSDTGAAQVYDPTWEGVQALLADNCERCHDGAGGGSFDLVSAIEEELAAGTTGTPTTTGTTSTGAVESALVIPGDADGSILWQAVTGTGGALPMPLDTSLLPGETVAAIEEWIAAGASIDGGAR